MTTRIRDYEPGDERTAKLLLEAALAPYGLGSDYERTDSDILDIGKSYIESGGAFRLLVIDASVAGMYGLFKESSKTCELRKMYLKPDRKGLGYGKILMRDAFAVAKRLGFSEMTLETNSSLLEAIAMYRKCGFKDCHPPRLSNRCDMGMRLSLSSVRADGTSIRPLSAK